MRALLIEDDPETADYIAEGLSAQGIDVQIARDSESGLALALTQDPQVIILDRLLPGRDGLAILKDLRRAGKATPVLCLTAMDGLDDRVAGLEAGGDDYLVKPFFLAELVARIRALARRAVSPVETRLAGADIELDLIKRSVSRAGREIVLLPQEFKLLEYLVRNAGSVVTRKMLLEHVWDIHFDPQTSVVESHMSRLRAKLSAGVGTEYIRTIRGSGYVFLVRP